MRGTDGAGGCYTIPMGLCYDCGFWALTLAPVLRLAGDCRPLGGPGGIRGRVSCRLRGLQWPEAAGKSLATASPLKCVGIVRGPVVRGGEASLWPACTVTVLPRRLAMEVAGLAVWGGAQRRTKLTDEQVPLSISAPASALPSELGIIGLDHRHKQREKFICP